MAWSITYKNQFGDWVVIGKWNTKEEASEVAATIGDEAEPIVYAQPEAIDFELQEKPSPQMSWPRYIFGGGCIIAGLTMIDLICDIPVLSLQWAGILACVYLVSCGLDLCSAARRSKWPWQME